MGYPLRLRGALPILPFHGIHIGNTYSCPKECGVMDNISCTYCADEIGPFERDHIYPKWRGGSDKESNLVWACRRCNQLKRGMRVDLFLDNLRQVREGRLRVVTGRRGPKFQRVYVPATERLLSGKSMTKRELLWEENRRA